MIDECRENVTFRIVTILTSYLKTLKCLFNGRYSRLQGLGDLWFRMGVSDSTFTAHTHQWMLIQPTGDIWEALTGSILPSNLLLSTYLHTLHTNWQFSRSALLSVYCFLECPFSQSTACLDLCRIKCELTLKALSTNWKCRCGLLTFNLWYFLTHAPS